MCSDADVRALPLEAGGDAPVGPGVEAPWPLGARACGFLIGGVPLLDDTGVDDAADSVTDLAFGVCFISGVPVLRLGGPGLDFALSGLTCSYDGPKSVSMLELFELPLLLPFCDCELRLAAAFCSFFCCFLSILMLFCRLRS